MKPDEAPPNTPNPTEPDAETIELDDSAVNVPAVVVRDIMTRGVVTLGMDRSVSEAKELFEEHGLHHLVVMERGAVAGIVSDRDVLRWISPFVGKMSEQPRDLNRLEHPVHQIMSRGVITIEPDAPLEMAAARLIRHRVGCLPVTLPDGGRLVGILTWRDLVRWMAEHHGMDLSDRGQTAPSKGAPKTDAA